MKINIWAILTVILFAAAIFLSINLYLQQGVQLGEVEIPEDDYNNLISKVDQSKPYTICDIDNYECSIVSKLQIKDGERGNEDR